MSIMMDECDDLLVLEEAFFILAVVLVPTVGYLLILFLMIIMTFIDHEIMMLDVV